MRIPIAPKFLFFIGGAAVLAVVVVSLTRSGVEQTLDTPPLGWGKTEVEATLLSVNGLRAQVRVDRIIKHEPPASYPPFSELEPPAQGDVINALVFDYSRLKKGRRLNLPPPPMGQPLPPQPSEEERLKMLEGKRVQATVIFRSGVGDSEGHWEMLVKEHL